MSQVGKRNNAIGRFKAAMQRAIVCMPPSQKAVHLSDALQRLTKNCETLRAADMLDCDEKAEAILEMLLENTVSNLEGHEPRAVIASIISSYWELPNQYLPIDGEHGKMPAFPKSRLYLVRSAMVEWRWWEKPNKYSILALKFISDAVDTASAKRTVKPDCERITFEDFLNDVNSLIRGHLANLENKDESYISEWLQVPDVHRAILGKLSTWHKSGSI